MQICDNFSLAAVKCGEYAAAARAFVKAVQQSGGKCVHVEVLEELLAEVRGLRAPPGDAAAAAATETAPADAASGREEKEQDDEGDGLEGDDAAVGEEAARILDAFAGLSLGVDAQGGGGAGCRAEEDAALVAEGRERRRAMLVRWSPSRGCLLCGGPRLRSCCAAPAPGPLHKCPLL